MSPLRLSCTSGLPAGLPKSASALLSSHSFIPASTGSHSDVGHPPSFCSMQIRFLYHETGLLFASRMMNLCSQGSSTEPSTWLRPVLIPERKPGATLLSSSSVIPARKRRTLLLLRCHETGRNNCILVGCKLVQSCPGLALRLKTYEGLDQQCPQRTGAP